MTITGTLVHLDSRDCLGRLRLSSGRTFQFHADAPTLKQMSAHFGHVLKVNIDSIREVSCWQVAS